MADEQYRWLDRETAERLLRGESLEAVDPADRDQAERLAKTLEALTAEPPLSSTELPGEAAALAAFRAVRAGRDTKAATVGHGSAAGALEGCDAPDAGLVDVGLVRIGGADNGVCRPRWARPVRLGLAAALAVGMIGGVALAAGTGVLTSPFVEDEGARPAATVSSPAPPERPLFSPSPEGGVRGGPTPDDDSQAPTDPGATEGAEPGGTAPDRGSAPDRDKVAGGWWKVVAAYCRDLRDGKELSNDRRRALESAAGAPNACGSTARASSRPSATVPGASRSAARTGTATGTGNGTGTGTGTATTTRVTVPIRGATAGAAGTATTTATTMVTAAVTVTAAATGHAQRRSSPVHRGGARGGPSAGPRPHFRNRSLTCGFVIG